jgi:hypothetical protein
MIRLTVAILSVLILLTGLTASAQQIPADSGPVRHTSRTITGWATDCTVQRGYVRIDDHSLGLATTGSHSDATGIADNIVVSLGDGGVAVLGFNEPVKNNPGPDFAVFENSFDGRYLELAFVDVSTDSIRWVRFPSVSRTPIATQTGGFGTTNPDNIYNLAGKYQVMFGTPFNLDDIADSAGIDINNIRYVRITDVVGSVNPLWCSRDSEGNIINDPWPTPFPQSGFDLDAVAVIDGSILGFNDIHTSDAPWLYPVPAGSILSVVNSLPAIARLTITGISGETLLTADLEPGTTSLEIHTLKNGIYIAGLRSADGRVKYQKFIKAE